MQKTQAHWLHTSVVALTIALSAACAGEAPLEVDRAEPVDRATLAARDADRTPELGACGNVAAPAGMQLVWHVYAKGVQIYRWNGQAWVFVEPVAQLYADAGYHGLVGTHYRGPKWESNGGDVVTGSVIARCDVEGAIQWLLLGATADGRGGVFQNVQRIQRLNTAGGTAPTTGGSFVGELREVPYTAEYYFYR